MKKEITFSNLYWSHFLRGFCFRTQAGETFDDVMKKIVVGPDSEEKMGEFLESMFDDVDDMEEYFYDEDVESIIEAYREYHGIEDDDD